MSNEGPRQGDQEQSRKPTKKGLRDKAVADELRKRAEATGQPTPELKETSAAQVPPDKEGAQKPPEKKPYTERELEIVLETLAKMLPEERAEWLETLSADIPPEKLAELKTGPKPEEKERPNEADLSRLALPPSEEFQRKFDRAAELILGAPDDEYALLLSDLFLRRGIIGSSHIESIKKQRQERPVPVPDARIGLPSEIGQKKERAKRLITGAPTSELAINLYELFSSRGFLSGEDLPLLLNQREERARKIESAEARMGFSSIERAEELAERAQNMILEATSDEKAEEIFRHFEARGIIGEDRYHDLVEERDRRAPGESSRRFVAPPEGRAEEELIFEESREGWHFQATNIVLNEHLRKARAESAVLQEILSKPTTELYDVIKFIFDFNINKPEVLALIKEPKSPQEIRSVLEAFQKNLELQEDEFIDVLEALDPKIRIEEKISRGELPLSEAEVVELLDEVEKREVRLLWAEIMASPGEGPVAEWYRNMLQVQRRMRISTAEQLKQGALRYQSRKRRAGKGVAETERVKRARVGLAPESGLPEDTALMDEIRKDEGIMREIKWLPSDISSEIIKLVNAKNIRALAEVLKRPEVQFQLENSASRRVRDKLEEVVQAARRQEEDEKSYRDFEDLKRKREQDIKVFWGGYTGIFIEDLEGQEEILKLEDLEGSLPSEAFGELRTAIEIEATDAVLRILQENERLMGHESPLPARLLNNLIKFRDAMRSIERRIATMPAGTEPPRLASKKFPGFKDELKKSSLLTGRDQILLPQIIENLQLLLKKLNESYALERPASAALRGSEAKRIGYEKWEGGVRPLAYPEMPRGRPEYKIKPEDQFSQHLRIDQIVTEVRGLKKTAGAISAEDQDKLDDVLKRLDLLSDLVRKRPLAKNALNRRLKNLVRIARMTLGLVSQSELQRRIEDSERKGILFPNISALERATGAPQKRSESQKEGEKKQERGKKKRGK